MEIKGRPRKITLDMEMQIANAIKNDRKIPIKKIRHILREYLLQKMKIDSPHMSEKEIYGLLDDGDGLLPGDSAIDKYVREKKLRAYTSNVEEMNKPWSLALWDKYPVPADLLPALMLEVEISRKYGIHLLIGTVKWMARLFLLEDKDKGFQRREYNLDDGTREIESIPDYSERCYRYMRKLILASIEYHGYEDICDMVGMEFSTLPLDAPTLNGTMDNFNKYFYGTERPDIKWQNGEPVTVPFVSNELVTRWEILQKIEKDGESNGKS